jgi:hypothetical protein
MKVEIHLTYVPPAGWFDLVIMDNDITKDVILKLSKGQPCFNAKIEAERLAVLLNCDFYENDKLIRKTILEKKEK